MFNAAYTVRENSEKSVDTVLAILRKKELHVSEPIVDAIGAIHVTAKNKPLFSIIKNLVRRTGGKESESSRIAVKIMLFPESKQKTIIFLSVNPIAKFYHIPEFGNAADSELEKKIDSMLSERVISSLVNAIENNFNDAVKHHIETPLQNQYLITDSRKNISRKEAEIKLKNILDRNKFHSINLRQSEFNLSSEITAKNQNYIHTKFPNIDNKTILKHLNESQYLGAKLTIIKSKLGIDHRMELEFFLYPGLDLSPVEDNNGKNQTKNENNKKFIVTEELFEDISQMINSEFFEGN